MTVAELIKTLERMPPDAEVWHLWDGRPRTTIELVWLAKTGEDVITSDYGMVCYEGLARPVDAPSASTDRYWETRKAPDPDEWKEFPYSTEERPKPKQEPEPEPFGGQGIAGRAEFEIDQ